MEVCLYHFSDRKGGFYVVMYGPIIVGIVMLLRGLIYAIANWYSFLKTMHNIP